MNLAPPIAPKKNQPRRQVNVANDEKPVARQLFPAEITLTFSLRGLMILKELFDKGTLSSQFVQYFPTFGRHMGSLIPNDRRSEFIIQDTKYYAANITKPKNPGAYYVDEGDDIEKGEAMFEAIEALKEISPVKLAKHHIFTVFFIMQNVDIGGTNETLYDAFTTGKTDWDTIDPEDDAVAEICKAVVDKSMTHLFVAFKKFLIQVRVTTQHQEENENKYLVPLKAKDYDALNEQTLKGFFQYESPELPGMVLPSAYHKLFDEDSSELRKNMMEYLNEVHSMETTEDNLQMKMDMINPYKCTTVKVDDEPPLGVPFVDYTFENAGSFRHFREGYCYTATYLASMIVGNRGKLDLKGLVITTELQSEIVSFLASYFVGPGRSEQRDILAYIDGYVPYEKEILQKAIDAVQSGPKDTTKQKVTDNKSTFVKEELVVLFDALVNHFGRLIEMNSVYIIMKYSANTIFEMLGLIGYIMLSDDVTVGSDANDRKFHISQYCTGVLLDVFDKCQKIPIVGGESLYDELMKVSFHNESLKSLLNDLSSTCIHGMGRRFMAFYLNAYKASRSFIEDVIACRNKNKDSDINALSPEDAAMYLLAPWKVMDEDNNEYEYDDDAYVEQVQKMFALLPMLIELPPTVVRDTGYRYLTCVKYEFTPATQGYKKHPLNQYAVVGGFKDNGLFHWIMNLDGSRSFLLNEELTSAAYMNLHAQNIEISQKFNVDSSIYSIIHKAVVQNDLLKHLQHIPYQFQKDRKAMFTVFANFTLHMCRFMTHRVTQDQGWKEHYENIWKKFGYDEYLYEPIFPKYIAASTENGTLWNDALSIDAPNQTSILDNPKFVGSLESFLSLSYKLDDNKQIVVSNVRGGDLTKAYQYSKLVGRILTPSKPLTNGIEGQEERFSILERYMTLIYGQSSELRQSIFRSITFSFKDHTIRLSDPNNAEGIIRKLEEESPEDAAKLLHLWKILQTIDVVNAPKKVMDLVTAYEGLKKENALTSVMKDVLYQIVNICISLQILSYTYFLALLPINDPVYRPLRRKPFYEDAQNIMRKWINTVQAWSPDTVTKKVISDLLQNYYLFTIDTYCFALNPEYNPIVYSSTELSFHRMSEEYQLIHSLHQEFERVGVNKQTSSDIHMITGRTVERAPNMYEKYDYTLPFLQDTFVYNQKDAKDGKSVIEKGDYQDSLPTRFSYFLRGEMVDIHKHKFVGFSQFEKIMLHILDGEPNKVIIEDKLIIEDYLEKYNETAKIKRWANFTSTQEILLELIINVIAPNKDMSHMYVSRMENYFTNLLAELLTSTIVNS